MRFLTLTGLCVSMAIATATINAQSTTEKSTARALELEETRLIDLRTAGEKKGMSSGRQAGIRLHFELINPVIASAVKYGNVTVTDASDDKGNDLKQKKRRWAFDTRLEDIERKYMYNDQKPAPKDRVKTWAKAGVPARDAKSVTIKGTVDFLVGKKTTVKTPWSTLKAGMTIETPAITKAGLTITIKSVDGKNLSFKATGSVDSIFKVDVEDATGKSLTSSKGYSGSNDSRDYSYGTRSAFDEKSLLVITLIEGKKTVSVPFEVKDVPLK